MLLLSAETLAALNDEFLRRCLTDAEELRRGAATADFPLVDSLAHRMVGAAGALQLEDFVEIARDLRAAARRRDAPAVLRCAEALGHAAAMQRPR